MASRLKQRRSDKRSAPRRVWKARSIRPVLERLEDRIMLDASLPPDLVVGRTLSSYTTGGIQNNQETITYTVYNEQAKPLTGVLLTDTLAPGEQVVSASQPPDQSGQKLAFSLGTIQGFDRATVTLTISLPSTIPLQLDTGAQAFAMLDGASVTNSTPAATLRQGNVDPSLLASTPDANTTDPFVQEEAAKLNYDPEQIFNFLHNDVGYNSYDGSVRGARGTLWSSAGNSLDVSSLGVALMRASGIPAQYVSGTLSQSQAQQLILSMFPASYQTIGYVPAGQQTSSPANDPKLLSETEQHYWFQFDAGQGMKDADPLMAGATIGQAFTAPTGTFAEVPDNLRAKTEVKLTAEIYSQASALFGLGNGLSDSVVLDQTFNDVDLVGRTLTIGNFVQASTLDALVFSSTTNTYTPYIDVRDDAFPGQNHDETITGQSYQEVLTNFPLGNQILTGLVMQVTTSEPAANGPPQSQTFSKTLFDRIGYAARQGDVSQAISVSPTANPAISEFDLTTLLVSTSAQPASTLTTNGQALEVQADELKNAQTLLASSDPTVHEAGFLQARTASKEALSLSLSMLGEGFLVNSGRMATAISGSLLTRAYFSTPQVVAVSSKQVITDPTTQTGVTTVEFDILQDTPRSITYPGQASATARLFQFAQGALDSMIEGQLLNTLGSSSQVSTSSASSVFLAALQAGSSLAILDTTTLATLSSLPLSAEAKARITQDVLNGQVAVVPTAMVSVNGVSTVSWLEMDPVTGHSIMVAEDGSHQAIVEYGSRDSMGPDEQFVLGYNLGFLGTIGLAATIRAVQAEWILDPVALKAFVAAELNEMLLVLASVPPTNLFELGFVNGVTDAILLVEATDPPVGNQLVSPTPVRPFANLTVGTENVPASFTTGAVQGSAQASAVSVSNVTEAAWSAGGASAFQVSSLSAANASVVSANGQRVGAGAVALALAGPVPVTVSGTDQIHVSGQGSLSFYGPAESSLGVSGNWDNYSAAVTGNVSLTLTTDGLTLNGKALPAGTYTITTTSATVSGSGPSTSPNFAGTASITAANGTINVGPGSGNVTAHGNALNLADGVTLTGYNGGITVAAGGGNDLDNLTLNGNAADLLTVSATPGTLPTDQNTPVTFQANVNTSFADTYHLTAQAPPGWAVSIDSKGKVTATPAPGLQGGTYPIRIIAQSQKNPDLVAQTTVNITITPTQPGITFSVQPDKQLTVPFNGAQLPTAFRATIHNSGPTADTYNLSFSNLPSGFTVLNSGTSVTIPAGQTGIVGIYLQPSGSQLPPPGTNASFTVTATSTTNAAITKTADVSFTIPAVEAVSITATPTQVSSTPGTATTATITLHNAGNVAENVNLAATTPAGLTVGGLGPVALDPGQTKTEKITLTPAASATLNSTLQTTITATFAPTTNPQSSTTQIGLVVRSAQTAAISQAAGAAGAGSNTQLATTLSELGDAVSQLQANPTDATLLARVQFLLGDLSTQLSADPALASFVPQLQPIQAKANSGDVNGMLALMPSFFSSLSSTLAVEASQQFSVSLSPNYVDMQTGQSHAFQVQLANQGTQAVTLNLSTPNLPSGTTATFSKSQVTLAPGATDTETLTLTATTLSNQVFTLDVQAAASVVQHTATAVVAVRQAAADVVGVTATPQTVDAGTAVAVSAQVFNTANVDRSILAHVDVLDNTGAVVKSLPDVPATLVPGTDSQTLDLGTVDTTGLANGIYYAKVSLRAADGTPLPGQSSQAAFEVGLPVTATINASPTLLPPGDSTVTTTISVANQTADDQVRWVGPQSGNWDDAANWLDITTNTAKVPGAGDTVIIDTPGVTVTVEAGTQAALGVQVAAGSTLAIAGGNLVLGGPSAIDGTLAISSGYLELAGDDVVLRGATQWTGGGINLDGHTLTNTGTITLTLTGSNSVPLFGNADFTNFSKGGQGGTLANSGTIVQQGTGALTLYDGVGLNNLATGRYEFADDGSTRNNSGGSIANTGTVIKTGGSGVSAINIAVDNRGTLEADSGTLALGSSVSQVQANQLTAGNWIARGGATLALPGNVTFSRANLTLDGAGSKVTNITNLAQNLGNFTITNGATFATTGNLSNSGALTIGPDSQLTVNGSYTQTGGATLDIELGGTPASGHFGQLVVTGSASLAGMFLSRLADGYNPAAADSFTVATTGGSSGSFAPVYLAQTANAAFQAAFNSNNIVLTAQAATLTPTTLSLTSSAPNGANWGDQTTFTATVTPTAGPGIPTGAVQFVVDGTTFGNPVPLAGGSASFTTALELGQHTITAYYLSDNTTFANSDDSAKPLTQVINLGQTPPLVVEVGYADGLRTNGFFPNPWSGSPNTVFVGNNDTPDGGAILIVNNSKAPITVNDVSVTRPDGVHYDLWGSNVVPAGGNLILTQTIGENFDTSDYGTLQYPQTYPDGETAHATHVDITVNGVLLPTFLDTGHILTTGGSDLAAGGLNESQNWRLIGTTGISNPGGTAASVVVTHNLPASGYTIDQATISPAPDSSSSSQVVWSTRVLQGVNASQFQVNGTVANMAPGEVRPISTGTTVAVTTTASTGQQITNTISLPAVTVAAEHIISIDPPVQSADRNSTVTYTVTLLNPLPTDQTYTLSTTGLNGFGVSLAPSITVKAGQSVTTPLTVTVPAGATPGTQAFEVLAQTAAGARDSVEGQLAVQPQVDVLSQALHMTLTPTKAAAGQGDSAVYTLTLTNVGETTDTYNLAGSFPPGVAAAFSQTSITVPPGVSNSRQVTLTLTPAVGTAAGDDPFTVTATSTSDASVSATVHGTLTVLSNGVQVTLTPSTGAPGSTFQLKVTNTGTARDTFNLALGGPAALVAELATSQVTLAPGASQTVNVTTGAVSFAVQGPLTLTATATSQTNPAATSQATAAIDVPASTGLTADLSPGAQTLPAPGTTTFLLQVHNTGNSEDAYTASITGTSGPITATLIGLDGQPAQTVPVFRLPGLSTGAILVQTTATGLGQGNVHIQVHSLSNSNQAPTEATLTVSPPPSPPPPSSGSTAGAPVIDDDSVQPAVVRQVVADILFQWVLGQDPQAGLALAMGAALLSYGKAAQQSASQAAGLVRDELFLMNDLTLGYELALEGFWSAALLDAVLDLGVSLNSNPLYSTPAGSELGLWAGAAFLAAEADFGSQDSALLFAVALATPEDTE